MSTAHPLTAHELLQRMGELLQIGPMHSAAELAQAIEQRLPVRSVDQLLSAGLTPAEIDRLVIARRTLQRRRKQNEPLTVQESDRLVRIGRVVAKAIDTFGTPEHALAWLRAPRQRFGQRPPLDLLISGPGARMVEEYLGQIDEGCFV